MADSTTCAHAPELDITFSGGGGRFGFSPVPCVEGLFTVDKLPISYGTVSLVSSSTLSGGVSAAIDRTTGEATLDLSY
jgi:hypothetical protein